MQQVGRRADLIAELADQRLALAGDIGDGRWCALNPALDLRQIHSQGYQKLSGAVMQVSRDPLPFFVLRLQQSCGQKVEEAVCAREFRRALLDAPLEILALLLQLCLGSLD